MSYVNVRKLSLSKI